MVLPSPIMVDRKDTLSPQEKNLLETLGRIEGAGITTFKPFNLSTIRAAWGENYDLAVRSLPKLATSDPNPAELVLMDTTPKPSPSDTQGVYPGDPLSLVIEKLRREGELKTSKKVPLNSRLDLSCDEIHVNVLPVIANLAGVNITQVRLPKLIEYALVTTVYPGFRQASEIWEWFEDQTKGWWRFPGSNFTACFNEGIMKEIYLKSPSLQRHNLGFRPVIVFR